MATTWAPDFHLQTSLGSIQHCRPKRPAAAPKDVKRCQKHLSASAIVLEHVRFVLGIAITITVPVVLYPSQHLRGIFKTQCSFCLAIRSPHLFLSFKISEIGQIGLQWKHRKTRHSSRSTTWTATGSFDRCRTAGLGRLSSVVWPVQTKCMNVTSRQSYILQVHISIWYQ